MTKFLLPIFLVSLLATGCYSYKTTSVNTTAPGVAKGNFNYDLQFLQQYDSLIILQSDQSQVIVSPKYQAKVFTSTADGLSGKSFGWINYKSFSAPLDAHMNAYGGENRFWLGPEGGRYSLFFPQDSAMVFANWKTPASFDTETWTIAAQNKKSVSLLKNITLTNYAGTPIEVLVNRTISILSQKDIEKKTGIPLSTSVKVVGYQTDNTITNKSNQEWNENTGMPCIWMLDMFNPSPRTVIILPYKTNVKEENSKIATTDYFGEIPAGRIKYINGVLLFKADGQRRGKLGIAPQRAKPIAASYDMEGKILTIALFDIDTTARYLNQEWNTTKPSFSGDAVNAYNDGPLENGSQLGPFYEIESVSPAAFLKPGASLSHRHSVFHFVGSEEALNPIAVSLLGISIADIKKAF